MLSFQRLDVYRCAIGLLSFAATIEPIDLLSRIVAMLTKLCR